MATPAPKNNKPIELCFREKQITDEMMDSWLNAKFNALFIGEHGTGKTARVLKCFEKNFGSKFAYFSGATLDPWIHVVGVPKAVMKPSAVGGEDREVLSFILPENLQDDVEAIFIDEWNRMHKVAKSAIMELIQFKSINGRRFPNLKVVWAAINPPSPEDEIDTNAYTVDPADPAQIDRFQIIIRLPNAPYLPYFRQTFGHNGEVICRWWNKQPEKAKKILSPRRLEYMLSAHKFGLDLRDLAPEDCLLPDLLKDLCENEDEARYFAFRDNPSNEGFLDLVKNAEDWNNYKENIVGDGLWNYIHLIDEEVLCNECTKDDEFAVTVMALASKNLMGFRPIMNTLKDSNLAKSWKKVEKRFGKVSASDVFDNAELLHCAEGAGLPDSFKEGSFSSRAAEGGTAWRGAEGNEKARFLNEVLLKKNDINWSDKDTQEYVIGFLSHFLTVLSNKEMLETKFLPSIRKILITLIMNGTNAETNARFKDVLTKLDKKLSYSATGALNIKIKPRFSTSIKEILNEA